MADFIHRPYQKEETIAALATPVGEGGIAVIRISGKGAIAVADAVFSKNVCALKTHTVHFGYVIDGDKRIDEALLIVMRAPRSYTGEDTVEIQCHGGRIAAQLVLDAVLKNGARPALAGEFTFRAYMNGKMDLTQAEAVQELIGAKSEEGYILAQNHLEGGLSFEIQTFQKELTKIAAILEAWVDFPEEGLEFATKEEILGDLNALLQKMRALLATFNEGQRLSSGISLALVGPPNAGKSSLMNALLRKERAIVTPIAGTTRDLVREEFMLEGMLFHLTDTAGIRETEESIEKEGIRRAEETMQKSDLVLLIQDVTKEAEYFALNPEKTILVWNKCDLKHTEQTSQLASVKISAKTGEGLAELKKEVMKKVIQRQLSPKDVILTNKRHYVALSAAIGNLENLVHGLTEDLSAEFLNLDAREALKALGEIIGTNVEEDILNTIFSTFCVGK